jgi:hypothetical protein
LIDKNLCGHLQKLASIHSSESFQFLQLSPYVSLSLANKSSVNHPLVFNGFQIKMGVQAECLTQMLIKLAGLSSALRGLLMFFSRSWPFSLLPSCLPIVHPDIIQVTGSLGHPWGPSGGLPQGNGLSMCLGV